MVNDKLQPKRTALPVSVLFTLVGALGLAAGAGQAKQLLSTTRPSTNKVKPQTPSVPAMPINNEVPVRAQSVRTTTVRILSTAARQKGISNFPIASHGDCTPGIYKQHDRCGDQLNQTSLLPEGKRHGIQRRSQQDYSGCRLFQGE